MKRPNVLCLISDDTQPGDLGCYGGQRLTPHLDSLAREGMQFTDAHAVGPVCTPSRYAYLTGQIPSTCPNPGFLKGNPRDELFNLTWNTDMAQNQANLATMFASAGYRTCYVGKFHCGRNAGVLGHEEIPVEHDPYDARWDGMRRRNHARIRDELREYGWHEARNVTKGNLDFNAFQNLLTHNLEWTTQGALDFLDSRKESEEPFLCYVAYHSIHGPKHGENLLELDPKVTPGGIEDPARRGDHPERKSVLERLEKAGLEPFHRNVGALWMDDGVGAILRKLEALGLTKETIVVYKADHGTRGKATVYDAGSRVPTLWRWPGRIAAGAQWHGTVQNIDFLPTLLELAGVEAPEGYRFDGRSYAGELGGDPGSQPEDWYNEMGTGRSVRTRRWKYVALRHKRAVLEQMKSGEAPQAANHLGRFGSEGAATQYRHYYEPEQLYDIQQDPNEQINLAGEAHYADVLAGMRARLEAHVARLPHPYPMEVDPFYATPEYAALVEQARARTNLGAGSFIGDRYW